MPARSTRLRTLILLPMLVLALATLACLGSSATAPTSTPAVVTAAATVAATVPPTVAATQPATAAPTAPGSLPDDARAALLEALQASTTAGPYRVVSTITSGSTTTEMHGEVVLPDRFHLVVTIPGVGDREYLIIGSTTYTKVADQWTAVQIDLSGMVESFVTTVDPSTISEVEFVGTEDVDGEPTRVYTYVSTTRTGGTPVTSNVKVWVGLDSGLPVKQSIDSEVSGVTLQMEQSIEYDPSITIEVPVTP